MGGGGRRSHVYHVVHVKLDFGGIPTFDVTNLRLYPHNLDTAY